MKSDKTIYWICINGSRFVGTENFGDSQSLIEYWKACGCTEKLTIEAEVMGDGKVEKSMDR